jgi:hypothetical protein
MNRTKAGRRRSFRAYCDPDREGKQMDRAIERAVADLKRHRGSAAAMTAAFGLSPVLLADAFVREMTRPL